MSAVADCDYCNWVSVFYGDPPPDRVKEIKTNHQAACDKRPVQVGDIVRWSCVNLWACGRLDSLDDSFCRIAVSESCWNSLRPNCAFLASFSMSGSAKLERIQDASSLMPTDPLDIARPELGYRTIRVAMEEWQAAQRGDGIWRCSPAGMELLRAEWSRLLREKIEAGKK